ncbi:hypothetical protein P261_00838 [Lachnospiraceae bacterium TWA4]|nr:hypothetical protein P261_00838 [Lachnospiraceae bacterium TWA4]
MTDELKDCKRLEYTLTKKASGKPEEVHSYEGYMISDYLKTKKPFKRVEFYAEDGFVFALSESEACKEVLLADKVDGNELIGGFTLVIPSDLTSRRWCKYIREMRVIE